MSAIAIPTMDDLPADLRAEFGDERILIKPRLPEIDKRFIPEVIYGYRVLILPVVAPDETESGFKIVTDTVRNMDTLRTLGVVLRVGPLVFAEDRGWPAGYREAHAPKEGQWVQFHPYSGLSVKCRGASSGATVELRYLNDSELCAPLSDEQVQGYMVLI